MGGRRRRPLGVGPFAERDSEGSADVADRGARPAYLLSFASWRAVVATPRMVATVVFVEPERSNRTPGPGRPKRAAVYALLDEAVAELRNRWGGLPRPEESRAIWDDIWVYQVRNSTALEGNTLVLREVGQVPTEAQLARPTAVLLEGDCAESS